MSAVADHLWQSTIFALAAGLLTWVLRKNSARVRYWLWFAASLKFLVPFSLLVGIGSHFAWGPSSVRTSSGLYLLVKEIGRPFTPFAAPATGWVLAQAIWLCGFCAVLAAWYLRWRRISVSLHQGVPLHEGREVEALRRIERIAGIQRPVSMVLSTALLEPGIFGIVAPILLWPKGISAHFEDTHLEAVVAHEVWHVRRRDNLVGALHMVVEAAFWFHPLVWWLGGRLIDERERACDEKVLEMGSERRVYAESILKTCRFCAGLPLACLSGVTGADLKKRIVAIMTQDVSRRLSLSGKLLLGSAVLATFAAPVLLGSLNATVARRAPQAENPDTATDTPMQRLLAAASIPGAACPNAISAPAPNPFLVARSDLSGVRRAWTPSTWAQHAVPASYRVPGQ
jgi:bla regulator protein blaR1